MTKQPTTPDDAHAEALRRIEACRNQGRRGTYLDLSNLRLTALPTEVGQLTALTGLDLRNNQLAALPAEVGQLTGLKELFLSSNQLGALPTEVGQLTALTVLGLSSNQLAALPAEVGQLTALTRFGLSNNQLTALPAEVGQLTALTELDLSNNQLAALPAEVGQLIALKGFGLHHNQLAALPAEVGQLTALTELDLSNNQLAALPAEVGQLTALTALYLFDNQLAALPAEVGRLTALMTLDLRDNRLAALPAEVGRLTALTGLYLHDNRLAALPAEVGQLTALTTLDLSNNQLVALPAEVGRLTALTTLVLSNNQLPALPAEIGQLTALTTLYLHHNPGLGLPIEVLGPTQQEVSPLGASPKSPREILDYYFRIAGEAGEALGECKLIVVGRGGAGKTSIVKRLSGQPYDPSEPETHGITIQKLDFEGQRGHVTGRVWDFGGQVVLHSMHEFFLTARSLYLLVLGERDDMLERDAAYWLQLIRSYAGDAPVVVALNKSEGRQRQFDRETLERTYGPILGWVTTECSEPDDTMGGIALLRQTLTTALDSTHMDSVRRKFPKKWRDIKAALEGMSEPYLDYAVYTERCRALGEADAREQTALAGDLHDLGVALNYARDPRLRDTTVLRPDWLANGVYAVLRANDLDDRQLPPELNVPLAPDGVITAESLARIHRKAECWKMLRAEVYPTEKRDFLLRLMELFHLSYPLDDEGREQLVPTLLRPEPPPETEEPEDEGRVRLRYEFQVVPAPLLPWFIARTFALIPNRRHWRRGAMLAFDDARAKVWATQDERYVFATAAGPEHARQRLLAIIRGTLHKVFNEYKALHPVEQWEHNGKWVPRETLEEFGVLPRERHDYPDDPSMSEEVES
jgi:internalin A